MKRILHSLTIFFLVSFPLMGQLMQTSGPIGGRFTHIALFQKSWVEISAGPHHVLAIDVEGHLWGWGRNDYGQIDGKYPSIVYEPVLIDSNRKWVSVAAGGLHSLAVDKDGNLYSWGNGERGQLGHRDFENKPHITKVDSVAINWAYHIGVSQIYFKKVSAGYYHSMALTDYKMTVGQIYGFGDNSSNGAVGINVLNAINIPTQIEYYPGEFIQVSCGNSNTFAIKDDNSLWAWGLNDKGQLGNDSTSFFNNIPQQIGNDKDWWQVSAGVNHTIALKNDSTMWGWGQNEYYQLGDGGNTNQLTPKKLNNKKWKLISAGNFFTLAIDNMDSLFVWGANHKGQLGTGNTYYYNTPRFIDIGYNLIAAGYDYSIVSKKIGDIYGFGDNESGKAGMGDKINNDSNWVRIKSNNYVIWALNESYDDKVYVSRDKGNNWNWEKINKAHESLGPSGVSIIKYFKGDLYVNGFGWPRRTSDLGYSWYLPDNDERKFRAILGIADYGKTSAVLERIGYKDLYIENGRVSWEGKIGQPTFLNIGDIRKIKTFENNIPFYGDYAYLGVDPYYDTDKSRIYFGSYSSLYNAEATLRGEVRGLVSDFAEKGYKHRDTILVATTYGLFKGFTSFEQVTDTSKFYNFSGLEYNKDFGIAISKGLGIFRLDDNLNLTQVPIKMQHITDFASIGKTLYISTLGGGVYKTSNAGETWQEMSEGLNEPEVYNIEIINNDLFAITKSKQFKFNNNKWTLQKGFNLDSISLQSNWNDYGDYRVKYVNKVLDKTFIIVELHENRGITLSYRTRVVIKPESSDAYELKNLPEGLLNSQTYSISILNSSIILATSKGLYKGENYGETWSEIPTPKLFAEVITDKGVLYARIPQYNSDEMDSLIYISRDNGSTWDLFSKGLPHKTTYKGCSKIYVSGDAIFAIIENKLWYSPANSSYWRIFDNQQTENNDDIKFTSVYELDGVLYLGTEAHSVWKAQLAPVLLSPVDSANNLPLTNINFKWSKLNEVQLYEFQLASDYNFTNIIHQEQTSSVEIKLTKNLEMASRYFWRVRLKNSEGLWSAWSGINVFATEFPNMFVRLSPASNPLNRTMVQPFYFEDKQNTKGWGYQLQTADDSAFTSNVVNHYYDTLFFFHTFEKGKNYFYRIRQFDTTIGFGGKWYPESNYHLLSVAPIQIDFSPYRDVFSFGNYTSLFWKPEHYNKFDYSQFPGLEGTPKSWYPSYHDFYAAFGWQHMYRECCCIRRYLLFGPKKCRVVENYTTLSKWQQALNIFGRKWNGSCSGFSFHSVERWLKNQRPYNYQIEFNDEIQRKINQQQQYQLSRQYYSASYSRSPLGAVEFLRNVFNSNNKNMLPVLSISIPEGGHAVVPYMITSGAQYDSIWVYDNWFHFDASLNQSWINKFIVVDKASGLWTFPNGWGSGAWHSTKMELTPVSSLVYSTPVLTIERPKKKRGEFLLSSQDSLVATTIFVDNPDGFVIKDSKGKEYPLNDINSLDSSNIHIIKMFGGLKEQPTMKILGAHIFADDEKSEYSIEKINNSQDTSLVNIFGLGYDGEVKWKSENDSKVSIIISDMNHGIKLKSKNNTEILDFLVVKTDEGLNYQKSIKIEKTTLGDNEEFFAGFSPDSKEFRITNNGADKEYDIVVDLGIEIPLTAVKFGSKETHIYRLEGLEENDTTRLSILIDRSASGKPDTTIVYDGRIDSTTNVAEWHNSKEVQTTKVDIYPNPVKEDLTFKLLLDKSTNIQIAICDINGQEVKKIINDFRPMGEFIISTDIRELSQGLYYLTITTPEQVISESFLIIK
jgi:alpha-tubulin suppressor-like RCC1 family protein